MKYAVFVALILASVTGCATMQAAATRSDEHVLAAAGFHMLLADTPERVAELQSLPPRKLMSRPDNGVMWAVTGSTRSISGSDGRRNAPTTSR